MRNAAFVLCVLIVQMLYGCSPGIVGKAPPGTQAESLGENALVFGSVKWLENGEEKKRSISLKVLRAEDMKKGTIKVEKDGRFYALVPKGEYIIYEISWWDPWDGHHWLVPKVAFKVADGHHAYYFGTLFSNVEAKRDLIGGLWVKGWKIEIQDEEDGAMEAFMERYPSGEVKLAKALMVHDTSIPRIPEMEKQSLLLDILRSLYFGIMPMTYH